MNYYSIVIVLIFILILIIVLRYIFQNADKELEYQSKEIYVLGTIIQLKAKGKKSKEAVDMAIKRIYEIDDMMSAFKKDSDISRINNNAGIMATKVNEETFYVIKKAIYYAQISQGTFEPTIRPLVELYGFGSEKPKLPKAEEIKEVLKLINYKDILVNDKAKTIMLKNKNQKIDLGAIAKGYAADEVRDIFISKNIKSAIIDLGGNIYAVGRKAEDQLWKIGIQDPLSSTGKYVGVISVANKSIVTSGDYERYFVADGKKYHHIINPRTGYPCDNEIISTTIISDNSIDGDGLTTCGFILGIDEGMKLIEETKGVDAMFITKDKYIYMTSGIKDKFSIKNEDFLIKG